jgi:hypothetical protein
MSATPDADQCSVLGIILGVVAFFAAPLVWGTLGILLGLAAYRGGRGRSSRWRPSSSACSAPW